MQLKKVQNHHAVVLVIDGGGRGSVLVQKYAQSQIVAKVLAIPGNDLMATVTTKTVKIFPQVKTTDIKDIEKVCRQYHVDLIDVAQDDAIAVGLTDALIKKGFRVLGPTALAGQIEWDKAWARNFMKKFQIPTPQFKICTSQKEGIDYIKNQKEGAWFIKASGLAAGKGALAAKGNSDALRKIKEMEKFGKAAQTFLIEQCLVGEEFSSFAAVNGKKFVILGHAQDYKRVFDGDLGPNTGGMGCSSPPKVITPKIEGQIRSIFQKAVSGLVKIKRPYRGILYLGGMIVKKERLAHRSSAPQSEGEVYVIEFNARWGDPEAQVIVPAIKNDFYDLANKIIDGKIEQIKIKKDNLYRVVVTAASKGYPGDYSSAIGRQIFGLDRLLTGRDLIFGAAAKKQNGKYYVNGGRLFYLVAQGQNVVTARQKAYNALSKITIEGNNLHYRTDIGHRDLEKRNDF